MTGDDLRAAIIEACPLINPRLSEVDWDAVAAVARGEPGPERLEAWADGVEDGVRSLKALPAIVDMAALLEAHRHTDDRAGIVTCRCGWAGIGWNDHVLAASPAPDPGAGLRTALAEIDQWLDELDSVSVDWAPAHSAPYVSKFVLRPGIQAILARHGFTAAPSAEPPETDRQFRKWQQQASPGCMRYGSEEDCDPACAEWCALPAEPPETT